MPNVTEIQGQVAETVKKAQGLAAETVKGLTETAGRLAPDRIPFAERIPNLVPQAKSIVTGAFAVAEQAVDRQRELVIGILDTVEAQLSKAQGPAKAGPQKAQAKESGKPPAKTEAAPAEAN